jgi:aminopeptidase
VIATDVHVEKMAKVIVDYCTEMKAKDKVLIQGTTLAVPLVEAVYKESIVKGAHPEIFLLTDNIQSIFYKYAQEHQLHYTSPFMTYYVENLDIIISIMADYNSKDLTNVNPKKIGKKTKANKEINATILRRAQEGTLKWNLTVYPTHAMAQEASMSLIEYEEFVYDACFLNCDDPIGEWKKLSKNQEKIVNYLNGKSKLTITGEDTELNVSVQGRTWVNSDGRRNFPSGEVFTSPVESSANGCIRFTYPGIYMGKEMKDITLTFEKGKVIEAHAEKGNDFLQEMLNIDEGARRLGEVAIGTNYGITKFTKNILFDEKIGGTMHLALGRSLPETGGKNDSAIHLDLVKDMKPEGRMYADDELFYKDGKILIS